MNKQARQEHTPQEKLVAIANSLGDCDEAADIAEIVEALNKQDRVKAELLEVCEWFSEFAAQHPEWTEQFLAHEDSPEREWFNVTSIGADGSLERVKTQYPDLIEKLNSLYHDSCDCFGRAVDRAVEMIRQAGIRSEMETNNLLAASNYASEKDGSVTRLVVSVASTNKQLFKEAYLRNLKKCVTEFPLDYAWPVGEAEKVADRMFEAMDRNSANYNSKAFTRTAKELGIASTRKAINAFWNT